MDETKEAVETNDVGELDEMNEAVELENLALCNSRAQSLSRNRQ